MRQHLHKGDAVNVTGSVNVRDWTDQSGVKHRKYEIVVTQVGFPITGKGKGANGNPRGHGSPRNGGASVGAAAGGGPEPYDSNGY